MGIVPAVMGGNPLIPANVNGRLRFGRLGRFGRGGRPDGKDIKPEYTKSFRHMNIIPAAAFHSLNKKQR